MDPVQEKHSELGANDAVLADDPFVGRIVSTRYRLIDRIGVGGWGAVYRAQHIELGTDVAVKILHRNYTMGDDEKRRFKHEAQAASRVAHANVARTFDYGVTDDGHAYIVMEYLRGTDLATLISRDGPLPESKVIDLFTQACRGLAAAHVCGIVHRDIKPSNLMIVSDPPEIKILDFGLAKINDGAASQASMTGTGNTVGTPHYMSPEQCCGQGVDERSDLYSLACCIYEAVTGKRAFDGTSVLEVLGSHLNQLPPTPSSMKLLQPVSPGLENVIYKALSVDPKSRQASAAELEKERRSGHASGYTSPQRRKNKQQALRVLTAALLIAAAAVLYLTAPPQPDTVPTLVFDPKNTTWDSLDVHGQKAMNQGNFLVARKDFEAAARLGTGTSDEKLRTLKKLVLLNHIQKNSAEETKLQQEIDRLKIAQHDGYDSQVTAKTLAKTLSLLPSNPSPQQRDDMVSLSKDILAVASRLQAESENATAAALLESAIGRMSVPLGQTSLPILEMKNLCVDTLRLSGAPEKALSTAESIPNSHIATTIETKRYLAENQVQTAEIFCDLKQYKKAEDVADATIRDYRDTDVPAELLLRARLAKGRSLAGETKVEEAVVELKAAVESARKAKQPKCVEDGLALIASTYALQDDFTLARTAYKELIESTKYGPPLNLARHLEAFGDLYFQQGHNDTGLWEQAEPYFQEALIIRQHLLAPSDPAVRTSLEKLMIWNLPAGHWTSGKINIKQAIALGQQLRAINDLNGGMNEEQLSLLDSRLAFVLFVDGRKQEALSYLDNVMRSAHKNDDVSDALDNNFYQAATALKGPGIMKEVTQLFERRVRSLSAIPARTVAQDITLAQAYDDCAHVAYLRGDQKSDFEYGQKAREVLLKHKPRSLTREQKRRAAGILENYCFWLAQHGAPMDQRQHWWEVSHEYGYYK